MLRKHKYYSKTRNQSVELCNFNMLSFKIIMYIGLSTSFPKIRRASNISIRHFEPMISLLEFYVPFPGNTNTYVHYVPRKLFAP